MGVDIYLACYVTSLWIKQEENKNIPNEGSDSIE
jgi:hypothetical protein